MSRQSQEASPDRRSQRRPLKCATKSQPRRRGRGLLQVGQADLGRGEGREYRARGAESAIKQILLLVTTRQGAPGGRSEGPRGASFIAPRRGHTGRSGQRVCVLEEGREEDGRDGTSSLPGSLRTTAAGWHLMSPGEHGPGQAGTLVTLLTFAASKRSGTHLVEERLGNRVPLFLGCDYCFSNF